MSERLTSRQVDAKDRRDRMTRQRRDLSTRIRKQKKSDYLARKRNVGPTTATYNSSETTIRELLHSYTQNPTAGTLQALEKSLPAQTMSSSEEKPLLYLSQEEEHAAIQFLECLRTQAISERNLLTLCLNILVKLTAITFTITSGGDSYYGKTASSWCTLVIQNQGLPSLIIKYASNYTSCLVIIGNLVGDPSTSLICPRLRQLGMVQVLVACLQQNSNEAVWALTNAIRHDTTAWACVYCSDELVSAELLESLLSSPQVATEAAWMVASLTGREKEVVDYLLARTSFCSTILACLERPSSNDQQIALLQALGSIAIHEENVIPLLNHLSLMTVLCKILQNQTNKEVLSKAIWLSGCLLVDARIENHPSTVIAAPRLVPILFQRMTSEGLRLEEKRDIAHALNNALALPPAHDSNPSLPIVPLFLPDKHVVRSSLSNLIGLLKTPDVDAIIGSVNVLNLLLQHDEQIKVHMEEEDIASALELLCDSDIEEAAEVAADLLDDYFDVDDETNLDDVLIPTNNVFAQPGLSFPDPSSQGGMGRGRGRGAVLPSWMTKNQ